MSEPHDDYVAVIFTSTRTDHHEAEYAQWSAAMDLLVRQQPGFMSASSVRDPQSGFGMTVAYFTDNEAALAWKANADHAEAQRLGREQFYLNYSIKVATVFREYEADFRPNS